MSTSTSEPEPSSEPEGVAEVYSEPEASPLEIVIPPATIAIFGIVVLIILYLLTKKNVICRTINRSKQKIHSLSNPHECKDLPVFQSDGEKENLKEYFFSKNEVEAMDKLAYFQNSVKGLFVMSLPSLLSLTFCPGTLFLYTPMTNFFWPDLSNAPNINDALGCFLVPAGMVYAIIFGFAVQEVLQKHEQLQESLNSEVKTSREMLSLVNLIDGLTSCERQKILRLLKTNIVNRILQAQREFEKVENVNIWEIPGCVKNVSQKTALSSPLFQALCKTTHQLFAIIPDNGPLSQRINPMQWILLETLSGFSFLGVLMIKAQSYRLELAMCIVTVISITMLVFAVSDLDSPFDGFFRIDMSSLEDFVYELYDEHQLLSSPKVSKIADIGRHAWE